MGACSSQPVRVIPVAGEVLDEEQGMAPAKDTAIDLKEPELAIARALDELDAGKKTPTSEQTDAVVRKMSVNDSDGDVQKAKAKLDRAHMDKVISHVSRPVRRGSRRVSLTPRDTTIMEDADDVRMKLASMKIVASRGRRVSAISTTSGGGTLSFRGSFGDIRGGSSESLQQDSDEDMKFIYRRPKAKHRLSIAERGGAVPNRKRRISTVGQFRADETFSPQSSDEELLTSTMMNDYSFGSMDFEMEDDSWMDRPIPQAPLSRRDTLNIY